MPPIVTGATLYSEMPNSDPVLISCYQARPLLAARRDGQTTALTSFDLGRSQCTARLADAGVVLPDGGVLPWQAVASAASSETACFIVKDGVMRKVQLFASETGRVYSLYPTPGAPTLLISGVPMHRIKGMDPWADTMAKIAAVAPVRGRVLDTATGLGYTAIAAARTADEVTTVEVDPAVLEIARLNPWSQELFANPKIRRVSGDSFEVLGGFPDSCFDVAIHDPPALALGGELYWLDFYRELYRVLRPGARLFHYVGDPRSRAVAAVTRGVLRRLAVAGFRRVTRCAAAFGVTAQR